MSAGDGWKVQYMGNTAVHILILFGLSPVRRCIRIA